MYFKASVVFKSKVLEFLRLSERNLPKFSRLTNMPIVFYYTEASPPCAAFEMTAEHLGIPLVKKHIDLFAGEHMKPEFLKKNPAHCVPTIDDDGFILWESRAIMPYLVDKYAPDSTLYPKDPKARAIVDKMLYYDIGTLYKANLQAYSSHLYEGKPKDAEKEKEFKTALSIFEKILENEKTPYAAGKHLTLADYSILAGLAFAEEVVDFDFSEFPKISGWLKRMKKETKKFKEINEVPLREFKAILEANGLKGPSK